MTYIKQSVFKNAVIQSTTHTSAQQAGYYAHGGDTVIGSEIDYTPISSSSKIIYEISYLFWSDAVANICVDLEQSSDNGASWSRIDDRYGKNFGWAQSDTGSITGQTYRFYLNHTFIVPSWTGQRSLRLLFKQAGLNWNWDAYLHKNYVWDGTTQAHYTNTSLLVHEI